MPAAPTSQAQAAQSKAAKKRKNKNRKKGTSDSAPGELDAGDLSDEPLASQDADSLALDPADPALGQQPHQQHQSHGAAQQQQQQGQYSYLHPSATPSDLLSTASDLYRQIEAAAASALSSHPSFAASFPQTANGTALAAAHGQGAAAGQPGAAGTASAADEAYWTSLPQHLRQFIRSALPLAAGWTTGPNGQPVPAAGAGANGAAGTIPLGGGVAAAAAGAGAAGALPPLTHDQLSSAAAQLAQMVQSNWGQFGLGPLPQIPSAPAPNGTAPAQQQQQQQQQPAAAATISLGSFPVGMPTREQMEEAIGSIGGQFAGGEFTWGDLGGAARAFPPVAAPAKAAQQQQAHAATAAQVQPVVDDGAALDETEDEDAGADAPSSASNKKKNKKKKRKERERAAAAAAEAQAAAEAAAHAQAQEAAAQAQAQAQA
ncbi:hypothetical protein JCM9279_001953, partial [Rhodotorula babjevae]